ncbi:hypothetical protein V6N13_109896 [Hibiscus sabdariffa]|uniref:Uncharacterized protein n=1 Tax=Hibiscus sabdariffa TaxID=183260 RepID=A0ABR2FR00_9ROSI
MNLPTVHKFDVNVSSSHPLKNQTSNHALNPKKHTALELSMSSVPTTCLTLRLAKAHSEPFTTTANTSAQHNLFGVSVTMTTEIVKISIVACSVLNEATILEVPDSTIDVLSTMVE